MKEGDTLDSIDKDRLLELAQTIGYNFGVDKKECCVAAGDALSAHHGRELLGLIKTRERVSKALWSHYRDVGGVEEPDVQTQIES